MNDGLLMLLSASHAMYEYLNSPRSLQSPRGSFEGLDEDTIIRIRVCARFVSELAIAHMSKGRFQHHLLDAAVCDVNALNHLHGWRPRPIIASGTAPPEVSMACDAADAYGPAALTTAPLNELLNGSCTGLALHTRLAELQTAYPGRRGPCYQAALLYMVRRIEDARVWGIFPPPAERELGNEDRPCEDTRRATDSGKGPLLFPCAACRATSGGFVKSQLTKVSQLIRDMFDEVGQYSSMYRQNVR